MAMQALCRQQILCRRGPQQACVRDLMGINRVSCLEMLGDLRHNQPLRIAWQHGFAFANAEAAPVPHRMQRATKILIQNGILHDLDGCVKQVGISWLQN